MTWRDQEVAPALLVWLFAALALVLASCAVAAGAGIAWLCTVVSPWLVLGFGAQGLFFSRQLVQWLASEKAGACVVPPSYWALSLVGALLTLVYALHRQDPVFAASTALTLGIYARNVMLLRKTVAS